MNNIRQIRELNKRELEAGISPEASWHADYRDTAYVYIGGLPAEFSEGDVLTIFSQYGEPTYINLVRDKETGKSKGFAFLKYEDQRSTDLAVDNLGGAVVQGAQGSRTLRVDHTRYKKRDDKPDEGIDLTGQNTIGQPERANEDDDISEDYEERPMLKEELELAALIKEHDDDDPMKAFLIEEKKEEVKLALEVAKKRSKRSDKDRKTSHGHRSHRTRERDHQIEDGHSTHRPRKIDHRSNQSLLGDTEETVGAVHDQGTTVGEIATVEMAIWPHVTIQDAKSDDRSSSLLSRNLFFPVAIFEDIKSLLRFHANLL